MKLGFRQGDAADQVIFELVDYKLPEADADDAKEAKKSKKAPAKAEA